MTAVKVLDNQGEELLAELFISRVKDKHTPSRAVSPVTFVNLLNAGVSGDVLRPVIKHIPKTVVVSTVGSDKTNFSKLTRRKRLTGRQTEDLNDLTKLWAELRRFFGWDETMLNQWIAQPLPILDGASATEIMSSQEGRDIIREHVDAMRYGDFA